jgi:hypothetical protein
MEWITLTSDETAWQSLEFEQPLQYVFVAALWALTAGRPPVMPACGLAAWQPTAWQLVDGTVPTTWHAAQPGGVGPPGSCVVWIVATFVTWHVASFTPAQLLVETCEAGSECPGMAFTSAPWQVGVRPQVAIEVTLFLSAWLVGSWQSVQPSPGAWIVTALAEVWQTAVEHVLLPGTVCASVAWMVA